MEFIVDWNAVCLICLQEGEMRSIYEKDDRDLTYCDKIMHCSSIEIQKGMNMPEQICINCVDDLNAAYRFRTNCESSNVILKSFVDARIAEMEIPAPNGQIYKYKPPTGLNVKRVKSSSRFEVKEEQIVIDEGLNFENDNFTTNHGVIFTNEDDSNQPIQTYDNSLTPDETIQEEMISIESDNERVEKMFTCIMNVEEVKKEEVKVIEIEKVKTGKRGRPKTRIQTAEFNDINPENVSSLVNQLSTVTYVKKSPEDEKPLKICEICGNGYKYQHALDSHMRRHRNEKPFSCEFCERSFVANVELRRHMRVHTGQKPYACKYCDRRFSDFGSRIKHERTHTGERPYECVTCGKAFAYAHVLSVHLLTHTGEKKFKCEICTRGFTKKIYLQGHMKHHTNFQL